MSKIIRSTADRRPSKYDGAAALMTQIRGDHPDVLPIASSISDTPSAAPQDPASSLGPLVAFNMALPAKIAKSIRDLAYQRDTSAKGIVLEGLKAIGLDIPDDLIQDRRKIKRSTTK